MVSTWDIVVTEFLKLRFIENVEIVSEMPDQLLDVWTNGI